MEILPKDSNGFFHGYCEYYVYGKLSWRGVCFHGDDYGYHDSYNGDGGVDKEYSGYWLDDERISVDNAEGNCYIWSKKEL